MLKELLLIGIILTSLKGYSFTLLDSNIYKFTSDEIIVNVSNTDCSNAATTPNDLIGLVEKAIERYWNSVPTSRLKFKVGSVVASTTNGNDSSVIIAQANANTVLVGCNNSTTLFDDASVLASGSFTGRNGSITGSMVIINNTSSTLFSSLSENEKLATLAHELGHAFGLGHSSQEESLMYYRIIQNREKLGQDDYDAVTFLYPEEKKLAGLAGSCSSVAIISDIKNKKSIKNFLSHFGVFFVSMLFGFLTSLLFSVTFSHQKSKR